MALINQNVAKEPASIKPAIDDAPVVEDKRGVSQAEHVHRRLRSSAISVIDRRLHEPDFKIDQLARLLGVSRATLFRAFAHTGGICIFIKQARLERARLALLARTGRHPSVAAIGLAHGFTSESHFSRSFQEHFGYRPGVQSNALPVSQVQLGGKVTR